MQLPPESTLYNACGEVATWRAVILQAFYDALSRKPRKLHDKSSAVFWLLHDRKDFPLICQFADYDMHQVREIAKTYIESGLTTKEIQQRLRDEREGVKRRASKFEPDPFTLSFEQLLDSLFVTHKDET